MEDIRIYDFSLNLLSIESKIISSNWTHYFNDIGKVEIHLPPSALSIPVLFENKYLVLSQGKKHAIITAKEIDKTCVIYGKTPNWILTKKVVFPFEKKGNSETICRNLVENIFSDCDEFTLGDEYGISHETEILKENPASLFDIVKEIMSGADAGHRVRFDVKNKKWVFEVLKGNEKNIEISQSSLTAYDMRYLFDLQDFTNYGYYKKEPENADEEPFWSEIAPCEESGLYRWEKSIFTSDKAEAKKELGEAKQISEISAKVKNLKWQKDFDLGDTLSVKFECGPVKKTDKLKVVGVSTWSEADACGTEPIFEMA